MGWHAGEKTQFFLEWDWETPTHPPRAVAQGLGSMVGTPHGSCMDQSIFCHWNMDWASLPSKDLSVQLSCHSFLGNSLISYRKQDEKDWDCCSLLNPVWLQSRVVVLLSGVRAHFPSRGRPLNPKHPLLHENSWNSQNFWWMYALNTKKWDSVEQPLLE